MRVKRWRGSAREQTCHFECGRQAEEWAYIHDSEAEVTEVRTQISRGKSTTFVSRYSPIIDDYMPLCKPCHQEYDK
jgi:hypothetical protein